jgi:hypothetical protein
MAQRFDIGAFGAVYLGKRDITRHCKSFSSTQNLAALDDTGMQPPGNAMSYIAGLESDAISIRAMMPFPKSQVEAEMQKALGLGRDNEPLLLAPWGAQPGYYGEFLQTEQTRFSPESVTGQITMMNSDFIGSAGIKRGQVLLASQSPGGGDVARNETQMLTFNNADPNQFFGLRAVGATDIFPFQAGIANSALKAGIEGLPAYAGRTVTVSGAALTGSTLKSGTKGIVFDGGVSVPALEVVSGLVESFVVESGDGDADYRWNNSTARALGFSEATAQSDQQALTGRSAAIVKGVSTAGVPNVVTGGTASAGSNGGSGAVPGNGFDGNTVSMWETNVGPSFIDYAFTSAKTPKFVTLTIFDNGTGNCIPARIAFYGAALTLANGDAGYSTEPTQNTLLGNFTNLGPLSSWTSLGGDRYSRTFALTNNASFAHIQTWFEFGAAGSIFLAEEKVYESDPTGGGFSANFKAYYPLSVTSLAAPTAAGSGATAARIATAGSIATSILSTTTQEGGTFGVVNMQTGAFTGPAVDNGVATSDGGFAYLGAPLVDPSTSAGIVLQHCDTANGTWATVGSFVTVTEAGSQIVTIPRGTAIKRYTRLASLAGQFTGAAALVGAISRN